MAKIAKQIKVKLIVLMTFSMFASSLLLFSGCSKSNTQQGAQQQSAGGEQTEEKVPDKLKKLEESIESIISALDGPSAESKDKKQEDGENDTKSQQSQQSQPSQTNQQNQQGQQGQQEQQGQQKQTGQQTQQSQPKQTEQQKPPQKDPWKEISTTINNIHYQWNDYAPEAVKKGLSRELTDRFGGNLNALTNEIASKDKAKTLAAANKLYSGIPDFYSLYRTKTSPEIKRMRYYARSAVLSAAASDWPKGVSDTGNLKASWTLFKNTLDKDQQELSGKLDLAIYELDKVVNAKDMRLTDIKGRVVLSDMQEIEKAMENKESGS